MKNKDFLEFITNTAKTPAALKVTTALDIRLSFRKTQIILKFLGYELLGALFSMAVCPQFGVGLVKGHGIAHYFRMLGDGACAAFCASLFLSSGMILAIFGMKGEEIWWIWRRYKISLIFLPALLWGGLMLTNVTLSLPGEGPGYHLIWISVAMMVEAMWFEVRSRFTDLAAGTAS